MSEWQKKTPDYSAQMKAILGNQDMAENNTGFLMKWDK